MQVRTEIEIQAPPDRVWKILMDFERYPEWNPYIHEIQGDPVKGAKLRVRLGSAGRNDMTFRPVVTKMQPEKTFRWLGHVLLPGLMDGEHNFQIEAIGENATRFIHSENYRGLLVWIYGRLEPDYGESNFVAMNEALKKRAESKEVA
jgi:hypothetical protein